MVENALRVHEGEGKQSKIVAELTDIHQSFFASMGMMRMISCYVSKADDEALAIADVVEVVEQFIPTIEEMRVRLNAVIGQIR